MSDGRVHNVPIHIPPNLIGGAFANAFRIIPDSGTDLFLDFCSYSESDKQGILVARVRVHCEFVQAIRDRLSSTLTELAANTLPSPDGFLVKGPGEGSLS